MLITLSGRDRAGTTALADWLRQELVRERRPVVVLRWNEQVGVYAALRGLRRRLGGGPRSRDASRTPLGRLRDAVLWGRPLRRVAYLADLVVFLACRGVLEQLGGRVLIMDRYFYDTMVDRSGGRGPGWPGFLARLTPRPDLPVLLETPEPAGDDYRRVFRGIPAPLRLCTRELDAAKRRLARAVHFHLAHDDARLA
jgi:thymidylate kinase